MIISLLREENMRVIGFYLERRRRRQRPDAERYDQA